MKHRPLIDRIRAHRSAPDVYDPPTYEQMAVCIEELDRKLSQAMKAMALGHRYMVSAVMGLRVTSLQAQRDLWKCNDIHDELTGGGDD